MDSPLASIRVLWGFEVRSCLAAAAAVLEQAYPDPAERQRLAELAGAVIDWVDEQVVGRFVRRIDQPLFTDDAGFVVEAMQGAGATALRRGSVAEVQRAVSACISELRLLFSAVDPDNPRLGALSIMMAVAGVMETANSESPAAVFASAASRTEVFRECLTPARWHLIAEGRLEFLGGAMDLWSWPDALREQFVGSTAAYFTERGLQIWPEGH